jgi:hypothetical protein
VSEPDPVEMRAALDNVERRIRASIEVPEVDGDFIPLRVTFDQEPHVLLVGDAHESTARVKVNEHWCSLHRGKWTSPPIPYRPGMQVLVELINGHGEAKEISTVLPGPDRLGPVFGPQWEPFGPRLPE